MPARRGSPSLAAALHVAMPPSAAPDGTRPAVPNRPTGRPGDRGPLRSLADGRCRRRWRASRPLARAGRRRARWTTRPWRGRSIAAPTARRAISGLGDGRAGPANVNRKLHASRVRAKSRDRGRVTERLSGGTTPSVQAGPASGTRRPLQAGPEGRTDDTAGGRPDARRAARSRARPATVRSDPAATPDAEPLLRRRPGHADRAATAARRQGSSYKRLGLSRFALRCPE